MGGRGGAAAQGHSGSERQIQRAYEDLQHGTIPWVGLDNLRARLGGLSREQQDEALMSLLRRKLIRLIPEENQKTITADDRRAAINVSGEEKHLIAFQSRL